MLILREYQEAGLASLTRYLKSAATQDVQTAFVLETRRPYRPVRGLEDLPYVCLRVPTGGGKTVMACHALGIAAREFLHVERTVCLWLVPSNAILEQTQKALRDRRHPYRQAIDAAFAGQVEVMGLADALYLTRGVLDGATVIIVSTLAALRVEDTDGRKVYETSGALQHHFDDIPPMMRARLEMISEGVICYSLANVLRMRRPVVIMDEAHNARTSLSFETLVRVLPSCVIEFTATPETTQDERHQKFASNVLHHVSARELKAAEMLKLPVKLFTHGDWKQVIGDALQKQRELEAAAGREQQQTGEYLRPIVLFQAQPQNRARPTLTVDVIKKTLLEDFQIADEQIAVATGQARGLEDVDLKSPNCPIRFIVTVQALREGWDCPFAYVLCTLAEQHAARAVEQILGRVLRMPKAKRKTQPELNFAYAFAASESFVQTAASLRDALIENGFQQMEAGDLIVHAETPTFFERPDLFSQASAVVSESPNLSRLDADLARRVTFDAASQSLEVRGHLSAADVGALQSCFQEEPNRAAVQRIADRLQGRPTHAAPPAVQVLQIPLLAVRVNGQIELFDDRFVLDTPWNLTEYSADLSEAEFSLRQSGGRTGEIDVSEQGRVELVPYAEQLQQQLTLLGTEPNWTKVALANWLDREISHRDIPQSQSSAFIHNALTRLIENRPTTLDRLARLKYQLRDALEKKIDAHRREQQKKIYQALMFGSQAMTFEVDPTICVTIDEDRYAPNRYYEGAYRFNKPLFASVGELDSEGEEFECAALIDSLPEVTVWVRNLSRGEASFWLQTSTDRFYPDFVALLRDGRFLVVEYKNARDWSNDDSKEKRKLGELWADRTRGRCLFIMPEGKDWGAIRSLAASPSQWKPEQAGLQFD
jgi:type III restriction enzyme